MPRRGLEPRSEHGSTGLILRREREAAGSLEQLASFVDFAVHTESVDQPFVDTVTLPERTSDRRNSASARAAAIISYAAGEAAGSTLVVDAAAIVGAEMRAGDAGALIERKLL